MKISQKQLINLPVYTESDNHLGKVSGFIINTESHTVLKYLISQSNFVKELLTSESDLEIASAQVVSISEEKMIVEDNVEKDLLSETEKQGIKNTAAAAASLFKTVE